MGSSEDLRPRRFCLTKGHRRGVSSLLPDTQTEEVICSILGMNCRLHFAASGGQNRAWVSLKKVYDTLTSQCCSAQHRDSLGVGIDLEVAASEMVPWGPVITSSLSQVFCLSKFREIVIRSLCSHLPGFSMVTACLWCRKPCSGSAHPSQDVLGGTEPAGLVPRASTAWL